MTKTRSPFLKEGMQKGEKKRRGSGGKGVRVPTERSKGKGRSWLLHQIAWGWASKLELATPRW